MVFLWNWANPFHPMALANHVLRMKTAKKSGCTTFLEQARCTHVLLAKREGGRERGSEGERERKRKRETVTTSDTVSTKTLPPRTRFSSDTSTRLPHWCTWRISHQSIFWWCPGDHDCCQDGFGDVRNHGEVSKFGTPRGLCKRSCTKALNCKSCWTWDEHRATKMVGCLCKRCLNTFLDLKHDQDSQTAAEDDF